MFVFLGTLFLFFLGCSPSNTQKTLPVLGEGGSTSANDNTHRVAPFRFLNQDGIFITDKTFDDRVYVADFFFTSCPTICPIMKKQMLRVYEKYELVDEVLLLSHTIDPATDDVSALRAFASALDVRSDKWHFVTGEKRIMHAHATKSYMTAVAEDKEVPGGFLHAGYFLLVDKKKRVRGVYDGTSEEDVSRLLAEIDMLLLEEAYR